MARFGELSTCYTGKNATDPILNISTMVRPSLKMMIIRGEEVIWYKHKYDKKIQNWNIWPV